MHLDYYYVTANSSKTVQAIQQQQAKSQRRAATTAARSLGKKLALNRMLYALFRIPEIFRHTP